MVQQNVCKVLEWCAQLPPNGNEVSLWTLGGQVHQMAIMEVILYYYFLFSVQKQHTELTSYPRRGYSNGHKFFFLFFLFSPSATLYSSGVVASSTWSSRLALTESEYAGSLVVPAGMSPRSLYSTGALISSENGEHEGTAFNSFPFNLTRAACPGLVYAFSSDTSCDIITRVRVRSLTLKNYQHLSTRKHIPVSIDVETKLSDKGNQYIIE